MISEEYLELNAQKHRESQAFGIYGYQTMPMVLAKCQELQTVDVLDYGCGSASLNLHMPFRIQCYDPAIPKHASRPRPADVVVCVDVMEHVEPEHVDAVLADLRQLAGKMVLFQIDSNEALKKLPDGSSPHRSLHPPVWWRTKIEEYFEIDAWEVNDDDTVTWAECRPKEIQ